MSQNDDYLWDGTGTPDPEVQRLERLLGRFRYEGKPAPLPQLPVRRPWKVLALAAALVLAAGLGLWLRAGPAEPAWEVTRLAGSPSVEARSIGEDGRLQVGQWLETDSSSRAQIQVPGLGTVDVEPNTRIGLKQTDPTQHRLALERGQMHALIAAPPRLFLVETPSALAVDLGCAYSLTVDEQGRGLLQVTLGYVALESHGHEAVVPSGAYCETRPGLGLGTPYTQEASEPLRQALRSLDFEAGGLEALQQALAAAKESDDLTLWHLARRPEPDWTELVRARMLQLRLDPGKPRHWQSLLQKS